MYRQLVIGLFSIALSPLALAQEAEQEPSGILLASSEDSERIREVVKGFYLKSHIGSTRYLNTHGLVRADDSPDGTAPLLSGTMALGFDLGSEFIDRERLSAAWELQFGQGLLNGPLLDELVAVQQTRPLIQGDIHAFTATGAVEVSGYLSRRFSIGARGGGGVFIAPLLMEPLRYQEDIANQWGRTASLHDGPLPLILFGPTIEYYTKLSHFSLGADVDITYVIGFDLGVSPLGYLKYTL